MSKSGDSDQSLNLIAESYTAMDPSMLAGYRIIFNKEINLFFAYPGETELDKRIVRFRILEKGESVDVLEEIRIEISTEKDIAFALECTIKAGDFEEIQAKNHLRIEFKGFSNSISDLLVRSVQNAKEYQVKFEQGADYGGDLIFYQTLRLRAVEVFRLTFVQSSDDFVRSNVQYRFNKLMIDLQQKTQEFDQQIGRLESRNPFLAKQIRENVEYTVKQQRLH
jgi:hypothetical protein